MADIIWSRDAPRRPHRTSRSRQQTMRPALSIMLPTPVSNRAPARIHRARSPHPLPLAAAHPRVLSRERPLSRASATHSDSSDALQGDGISEPMLFDMSPVVSHRRIEVPPDTGSPTLRAAFTPPPPLQPSFALRTSSPSLHRDGSGSRLAPAADIVSWARTAASASSSSPKAPNDAPLQRPAASRPPFRYAFKTLASSNNMGARSTATAATTSSRLGVNVHKRPIGDPDGEVPELVHTADPCLQCVPSETGEPGSAGFTRRRRSSPDNFTLELEAIAAMRQLQQQQQEQQQQQHQRLDLAAVVSSSEDDTLVTPNRLGYANDGDSVEHDFFSKSSVNSHMRVSPGSINRDADVFYTGRTRTHSPQPIGRGRNRSVRPLIRTSLPGHVVQQMSRLELDSPGSSFEKENAGDRADASSDAEHRVNAFRYDRQRSD